ncbi:olfactory receptor 14A16-like [Tachyglossus aculeatus]|uniref:olfactory receptor 14A16-like n=1 Tax=Tachyglossus aculeatus TaxID=9261 RepID=UPI0018F7A523|nr:olfactory receptor 14A16-like [Tachyglossus aculeatus]
MANASTVTEFVLLGFYEGSRKLQLVHAALFLLDYLAALTGNLLIVAVTIHDRRLHSPMYFFLRNGSFIYALFSFFVASELFILMAMSYDHYVAFRHPLHYELIMDKEVYVQMVASYWFSRGIFGVMCTAEILPMSFCGFFMVQQFFYVPSLLKASRFKQHVILDFPSTLNLLAFPQNMANVPTVTRFLLLGFSGVQDLQVVHAVRFLLRKTRGPLLLLWLLLLQLRVLVFCPRRRPRDSI